MQEVGAARIYTPRGHVTSTAAAVSTRAAASRAGQSTLDSDDAPSRAAR